MSLDYRQRRDLASEQPCTLWLPSTWLAACQHIMICSHSSAQQDTHLLDKGDSASAPARPSEPGGLSAVLPAQLDEVVQLFAAAFKQIPACAASVSLDCR